MYSKPGDSILELCCGSGPACRASVHKGRICVDGDYDLHAVNAVNDNITTLRATVEGDLDSPVKSVLHMHKTNTQMTTSDVYAEPDKTDDDKPADKCYGQSTMGPQISFPGGRL